MKAHLRTLGTLDLHGPDGSELRSLLLHPKLVALLVYIALAHPTGFHRRDSLLALFWPEQDTDHARGSLRQALHELRRWLGGGVLLTRGEEVGLDPATFVCDAWSFDEAALRGDAAAAVAAYGGEFLAGFFLPGAPEFEQWMDAERRRLSQSFATMLERLAEDSGPDATRSVEHWRRLAEHDPFSPRVAIRLMQALEAAGDAPSAILHADRYTALLREQLDAEPDPDVLALAERLRKRPTASAAWVRARAPEASSATGAPTSEATPAVAPARGSPDEGVRRGRRGRDMSIGAAAGALVGAPMALVAAGLLHALNPRLIPVAITGAALAVAGGLTLLDSAVALALWRVRRPSLEAARFRLAGPSRRVGAGFGFALGVLVALSGAYTLAPRQGPAGEAAPGLVIGASRSLGGRATPSIRAYELYLRGHIDVNRWNEADLDSSIVELEAAIAADSTFAEARAVLANAYLEKADLFQPKDEYAAKAHVQAGMALLLDPDLPLAHIALGNLLWTDANHFPHEAAFREFARAAELGPDLSTAHDRLALVYLHVGLLDDALAEARRGAALDPLDLWSRLRIGHVLLLQHHFAKAAEALRAVPVHVAPALRGGWLAEALLQSGHAGEAERLLDSLIMQLPRDPLVPAVRAVLRASQGDSARARLDLAYAAQRVPGYAHGHHAEFQIGTAYVMLGRPDSAVAWLDRAARHGFPCYPRFAGDPLLRPLRHDPRFLALLDRLRAETAEYGRRFAAIRGAGGQERADTSRPGT